VERAASGFVEGGLEESLACLEDHLIINLEELVHKQPSPIRAQLSPVPILQHPIPFNELDATLLPGKGIIIEFDVAASHPTNSDNS